MLGGAGGAAAPEVGQDGSLLRLRDPRAEVSGDTDPGPR